MSTSDYTSNMPTSVLFLNIFKTEDESEENFAERVSLYEKKIKSHNLSVWQSLPHTEKLLRSKGKLTEIMNRRGLQSDNVYKHYNPYVDSGFDIFQPGKADTDLENYPKGSTFYEANTTNLLHFGIAGAMYTLNPEEKFYNEINYDLTRQVAEEQHYNNGSAAALNSDIKPIPYGGVFSQILLDCEYHLMETIIQDMEQNELFAGQKNRPIKADETRCNAIPQPYKIHPRSSIYKKAIRMANSTGIIDSGYRGELCGVVDVLAGQLSSGYRRVVSTHVLEPNKRYFQICKPDLSPFYVCQIEKLPSTERGAGGFGSTGN